MITFSDHLNTYFVQVGYNPNCLKGKKFQTLHIEAPSYDGLLSRVYDDPDAISCKVSSIRTPAGEWIPNPETPGDYDLPQKEKPEFPIYYDAQGREHEVF